MAANRRLGRRRPVRKVYPRILTVCEGEKSEPSYFAWLRRNHRSPVHVEFETGGDPKKLVETAIAMRAAAKKRARSDPNEDFEQVWCVFDVDEHTRYREAVEQAIANKLLIAVSNPCFELWLLLHFQRQNRDIHRHDVQRECRMRLPGFQKVLLSAHCQALANRHEAAVERAQALVTWQQEQGRDARANPSTEVYKLAEQIRTRGELPLHV
jgi:hypothetical protein